MPIHIQATRMKKKSSTRGGDIILIYIRKYVIL